MASLRPPLLPLLLVALAVTGCGSSGSVSPDLEGACVDGNGPAVSVEGTIRYERLVLHAGGLGPALETRPARFVDVRVHVPGGGPCYAETSTDATGSYALEVHPPAGSDLEVWVYSRTNLDPLRQLKVHDALPPPSDNHRTDDVFRFASAPVAADGDVRVDLVVPYAPGTSIRPSIGFGVLDVLATCSDGIHGATGVVPPLCHVYTTLGNNGSTSTSFYSFDARALSLLAGAAGQLDTSDTDYFDDAVIAHEYQHFVEFNLAHSLSRGGIHVGEALEPGFAWSEGQSTAFGCLYLGTPLYVDTRGTAGGLLLAGSAEDWSQTVWGIGSESTVTDLVWDLVDGGGGITDADGDVAALPLGRLLDVLFAFDPAQDAPYLGLLLDRLVAAGHIAAADVDTLLRVPEDHRMSYPLTGDDVWPARLAVPGTAVDFTDSTFGNPCRGLDASRWYRLDLAGPRTLTFDLAITPSAGSGDNLDLYLLGCDGEVLAGSIRQGDLPEQVGPLALEAGCYLVRVEASCNGAGNAAGFTLTVTN